MMIKTHKIVAAFLILALWVVCPVVYGNDFVKYDYNDLEKIFDFQIQTLKDRGCPAEIVALLQNQRDRVILKAEKMDFMQGNTPFIPVIPRNVMEIKKLTRMVEIKGRYGKVRLLPRALKDIVKVPDRPYYIYDIENGKSLRDKSPEDAARIITWDGTRRCLTIDETIAFCTHTKILNEINMWAAGSNYSAGMVPCMWYMRINGPMLSWCEKYCQDAFWGTPSCRLS